MKKNITLTVLLLSLFVLVTPSIVNAQSLSTEDIKAQMVKEWERSKAYTIDYLNTMPANKYSFKAADSIRSFAQQMLHLAGANVFFMSLATDQKAPSFPQDLEQRVSAQTKDSVMYFVTRYALINKAIEHQAHHRGQTTIYIRLQGIKPPQERLF